MGGVGARKTLGRVLSGTSDNGIRFEELCSLLESLGFESRSKGSHRIFRKAGVEDLLNLQRESGNVKAYQVRQVRATILRYGLAGDFGREED